MKNGKNSEERSGFWKIGYLENQDYLKRMQELTHKTLEGVDLDQSIESSINKKGAEFYDVNFRDADENKAVYAFYPTGQKAYYTNHEILGGFYRMDAEQSWKGVYLEQDRQSLQSVLAGERQRSALEDYTYIYDYDHITRICSESFKVQRTEDEWANYIGKIFMMREKEDQIHTFTTGSYFPAEELSIDGKRMYFWMERNDKQGVRQKGFGISLVDQETLLEYWSESQYKYTLDRMFFPSWEALEEFIDELAVTAMPENWGRINAPTEELSYGHPVLKSYVEYTLVRLRNLDKEQPGYLLRQDQKVYFNTGLLNKFFRQIVIGVHTKKESHFVPGMGNQDFEFFHSPFIIVPGHDTKFLTEGRMLDIPRLASYFEEKDDVLYDASLEIMLNDEHIFEDGLRAGRIPSFKDEHQRAKGKPDEEKALFIRVQESVVTAIQRAKLLAERNYKLPVTQYWKETNEVQFLLPLYIEESEYTGRPECALALRRSKSGDYYEGTTILSLDMAYNNARLIAKPDVTWLNREDRSSDCDYSALPLAGSLAIVETKTTSIAPPAPVKPKQAKPAPKQKQEKPQPKQEKPAPKTKQEKQPAKPKQTKPAPKQKQEKPQPKKVAVTPKETVKEQDAKKDAIAVARENLKDIDGKPDNNKIGSTATLINIVSRPSGKGLRGQLFDCIGTVARNLLKHPVTHYTGGDLKVKIVDINPQGNQYILEPIE